MKSYPTPPPLFGPIAIADLMDRQARRRDVMWAGSFAAVSAALVLTTMIFANVHGPRFASFVPVSGALWCVADLLTAYFLFTQFGVNGMRAFAILGIAYGTSGILAIPYVIAFQGAFLLAAQTTGWQQVSNWLWIVWHISFPVLIGGYHLLDRDLRVRTSTRVGVRRWLTGSIVATVVGSLIITFAVVGARNHLPITVDSTGFSPLFSRIIAPALAALNVIAAIAILASRRASKLQLWVSVALLIAGLDAALNAGTGGRYFLTWYVGKLETLATSGVVLLVLLSEVTSLYSRLGTLATIDALTGLSNRQAFDSDARFALLLQRRHSTDVAFLVVDIDFFKQYNDTYGHQAGDACLTQVAHCIRRASCRSVDLVGRFGGEEFVVLLHGTNALGAMRIGEAIRACVEELGIVHAGSSIAPVVTVSVGVTHAKNETDTMLETLFKHADDALYRAKLVRNTVVMDGPESPIPCEV